MKRLLKKFISVFAALVIVFFVVAVPVSASTDKVFTAKSEHFNGLADDVESEYFWSILRDLTISGTTVNSDKLERQYYIEVSYYGFSSSHNCPFFGCLYISFEEKPEIYYDSSEDMYYIYLNYVPTGLSADNVSYMSYNLARCDFIFKSGSWNRASYGGSLEGSSSNYKFSFNEDCSIVNVQSLTIDNLNYNVYFSWDTDFNKKDIDIKVNVDSVSDTLPVSVDLSENPDFYIDITNNTKNAIQFVAWISDTPASSGAYNSYSRLNWTYSMQQWVYLYHGTWSGVDTARTVLDIYGDVVDTADLFGLAWWKDYLVGAVDDALPKAYYSRENISSPYHVVTPGSKFNQKFSFNTATLSKDKEYYFNIVYRQVVSYEIIDGAIVLLNSAFHDNFEDLNYYDLGYCTAFSLTADTTSDGSTSTDTNIKFPSGFDGVIDNTKNPSASIDADGNISLSGGNNDLNNSINFSPKIDNSNYNGGVTINNNLGGSGAGSYGDFDGDVSQLNKLLHTCTSFFGFLKAGLTAFIPSESIFTVLFSSAMLVIVFLRIWGR